MSDALMPPYNLTSWQVLGSISMMDTLQMDIPNPLTPASFAILLALAGGERHGYAIMMEIAQTGKGVAKLGPGTLYRSIKQLRAAGFIADSGNRLDPSLDDQRRRYYRLTASGRAALESEAQRLAGLVEKAAKLGLIPRDAAYA